MLSLLGVAGYGMGVSQHRFFGNPGYPIDRDVLIMPEILIENYEADVGRALRPAFDSVWNAAGWSGSINYDQTGRWVGHT